MAYLDDSAEQIATFEGKIPWMYLDDATPANVTAGIGFMLPNLDAALALPWYVTDFSREATAKEVASEFVRVKAMAPSMAALRYQIGNSLMLTDTDMHSMLARELGGIDAELAAAYATYKVWPVPAKLAALDMAYNLGFAGLKKFAHFNAAADAEDWMACSNQCDRKGPGPERNQWTQEKFLQAYSMKVAA